MNSYTLNIYLQPGAKQSQIVDRHDGYVKIKVKAPPIEGKANEALIDFLSHYNVRQFVLASLFRNLRFMK